MKSAQIKKYGGPEVIEIVNVEKPKPGAGQVLVKVYASSINPFDVAVLSGRVTQMTDSKLPMTIGLDIAGVVSEIGEGVEGFFVGNKVFGSANVLAGGTGAFAELAVTPAGIISKMPGNLNFDEAAAIVLTGVSALQALTEHIDIKRGQKILIHRGAGGIGTMAIQIAKSIGAYVVTTATGEGVNYVKKLGADEIINYKSQNFEEVLSDCDAVYDTIGGEVFEKSFKVLKKKGGIIVSMVAKDEKGLAGEYEDEAISQFTKVNTERLNKLAEFIEKGVVKPHIDKVFLLDRIREAFLYQMSGEVMGKVVIKIKD